MEERGYSPYPPHGTNYSHPGSNYPVPGANFSAPVPSQAHGTNYSAPGTHYPIPGNNFRDPYSSQVPGAHYLAPGTNYPVPGNHYSAPGTNYSAPGSHYPIPGNNFTAPVSSQAPGTNYPPHGTNYPDPGTSFQTPVSSKVPGTNFSAPRTNFPALVSSQASETSILAQGTNKPGPGLSQAPVTNISAPVSSQIPGTDFSAPNVSEKRKLPGDEGENSEEDESPPKKQQIDNNESDASEKQPEKSEDSEKQPEKSEDSEKQTVKNDTSEKQTEKNDTSEKQTEKTDTSEKQTEKNDTSEKLSERNDSSEKQPEKNEEDEATKHQVAEDICVEYDMPAFFGDDDEDEDEEETPEKPEKEDGDGSNVYYSGQGFHEIVEPGNQGTVPCKACNRPFDSYRGLLQHVTHRKLCKELYGAEIEELKLAIKMDPTSKKTGDPSSRYKELVECNGCREQFRSLLSHLSKKPQCQVGYDMGLLKAQAEAAQKEKMKQYYRAKNIKDKNKSFDYGDYKGGDSDAHNSSDPSEMVKSIYNEHSNGSTKFTQENSDSNSKSEIKDEIPIKQEDINKVAEMMGDKGTSIENGNSSAAIEAAAAAAAAVATSGQSEDGSGLHPLFPIAGLLHTMQKMNDGDSNTNNSQLTPQQIFLMNFMSRVKTAQAANALANKEIKEDRSKPGPKPVTSSPNIVSSPKLASSPAPASTSGTPNQFQRNGGPANFGRKVGRSGMFMCARCKTGFINKDTYETHLSKSDCSKPQPGTRYPIKKSSSSGVYVCSKCKQGFIGTEVFEAHLKTHET